MMRKVMAMTAAAAAIGMILGPVGTAFARPGGGSGGMGRGSMVSSGGSFTPGGFSHGNKTGWNGGSSPPGWSHGTKKGWGGGTMPPGLSR